MAKLRVTKLRIETPRKVKTEIGVLGEKKLKESEPEIEVPGLEILRIK